MSGNLKHVKSLYGEVRNLPGNTKKLFPEEVLLQTRRKVKMSEKVNTL